jgi:hypothetical protein
MRALRSVTASGSSKGRRAPVTGTRFHRVLAPTDGLESEEARRRFGGPDRKPLHPMV